MVVADYSLTAIAAVLGCDGARFLRYICQGLENPFFLAFEG